jgi:hypothetical protein
VTAPSRLALVAPLSPAPGSPHLLHIAVPSLEANVRRALQNYHDPVGLASNPLATGIGVGARADSMRALLHEAISQAFGASSSEQLLRRLIDIGYLATDGGHQRATASEHLSRSTYFRRLGEAVRRIAVVIANLPV